jgi:hypothetical protein
VVQLILGVIIKDVRATVLRVVAIIIAVCGGVLLVNLYELIMDIVKGFNILEFFFLYIIVSFKLIREGYISC